MRSTVLSMSVARWMNRSTRSLGIAGRGPCAWRAIYASAAPRASARSLFFPSALRTRASVASRAAWLLASELDTAALLRVAADERVDALDARGDRRGRRRIREADVLSL